MDKELTFPSILMEYCVEDAKLTVLPFGIVELVILVSRPGNWKEESLKISDELRMKPWRSEQFSRDSYIATRESKNYRCQIHIGDGASVKDKIASALWGEGDGAVTKALIVFSCRTRSRRIDETEEIALPDVLAGCLVRNCNMNEISGTFWLGFANVANRFNRIEICVALVSAKDIEALSHDLEEELGVIPKRHLSKTCFKKAHGRIIRSTKIVLSPYQTTDTNGVNIGVADHKSSVEVRWLLR